MASLQIRELPPDVYEALAHRAKREGRSLAQQAIADLRGTPELKARQRRMATIERLRRRPQQSGMASPLAPPEELIREDRER